MLFITVAPGHVLGLFPLCALVGMVVVALAGAAFVVLPLVRVEPRGTALASVVPVRRARLLVLVLLLVIITTVLYYVLRVGPLLFPFLLFYYSVCVVVFFFFF